MNFDFATAGRIIFGKGKIDEVPRLAADCGRRILLVRGKKATGLEPFFDRLERAGLSVSPFVVSGEPAVRDVEAGARLAGETQSQVVVAIGGGSVLDAGKAIAALATNDGPILDYLEVVGKGLPLTRPCLPVIAVPTTAGTGSEVTRNAVMTVPEQRVKVSLRSPGMLPRVAVIDPLLTLSLPPEITASSGMDALTQVLEPYVSRKANPLVDLFCQEGLRRAAGSLQTACEHGDDIEARENMVFTSLLGGLALANAGLGAVHGFAGPLGGYYNAPHGALCAALLAPVVRVNIETLRGASPRHPVLARYLQIAQWLTDNPQANLEDGIRWLENLTRSLNIPGLRAYGVSPQDYSTLIEKAAASSSMKGNPADLTSREMRRILEMAF